MSDFTSGFWNIYVIVLVIASIAACAWLLWATGRVKVSAPKGAVKADGSAQADVTGHVWDDDLQEYNNPLPKWWSNLFWVTIAFGVVGQRERGVGSRLEFGLALAAVRPVNDAEERDERDHGHDDVQDGLGVHGYLALRISTPMPCR